MDSRRSRKRNYKLIATIDLSQDGTASTSDVVVDLNDPSPPRPSSSEPRTKVSRKADNRCSVTVEKEIKPDTKPTPAEPAALPPRSRLGECPICLEDVGTSGGAVCTKCGHVFCRVCLMEALKKVKRKCPVCNTTLPVREPYHRLYID